ncbi:MAG: DEAD/DEAH box helicase family protein [Pirellulaceae bacterium]|nr:DEAD/DEAH box helicase family protein [Pirellulaceae bacterium]
MAWSVNNLPPLKAPQQMAVDAFTAAGQRGVVVMPTGTGKTVVGLFIARKLAMSTLVIAPIRDQMYQWHRRIRDYFDDDAGIIGDTTFDVRAVSVTTYDSAALRM